MSVAFGGFNENTATFKTASEIEVGTPVAMSGNGTVKACASGSAFCGIATSSDNSYVSVQLSGTVTLPYTGTAPAVGYSELSSGGTGVKADSTNGREYLVLSVDTAQKTVTFLL